MTALFGVSTTATRGREMGAGPEVEVWVQGLGLQTEQGLRYLVLSH